MTTLVEMTNPIIIQANLSVQSTQGEGLQVSSLHSLQLTQIAHRLTWMALCIALTILRFKSSGTNSNRFHLLRYVLHISAYFFYCGDYSGFSPFSCFISVALFHCMLQTFSAG